ncbi:right-handed parallel beta-helix repeat-containing protein [candidate division KSB1 bacterium]|nr:right-handed parallel beta-helix repeat-containing protein [candidate division KSB1 bacterium]
MKHQARNLIFLLAIVSYSIFHTTKGQAQIVGLYNPDGSPHSIHLPNPVTGQTINVVDYGADPADNATDDRPAIQAALNAASFGDELYFPNGVYNLNSGSSSDTKAHFVLKSGVNWRGESQDSTVLVSGFDTATNRNYSTRALKMRGLHAIVLSDFTISSIFDGQYSTNTDANNPDADGPVYVVSIEDDHGAPCYNIDVQHLTIEKYQTHAIRLSNSHDAVVKHSTFKNATDVGVGGAGYGVSIQGDKSYDNSSKFNLVDSCQCLGPYIRHGILMQYATHNNAVTNNMLVNTRLDAIDLHGEDEYCNEIYQNEIHNVKTGAGVGVGNTGSTHDASGPYNYIHDNTVINCREGVKVYLGSPDTRIENNIITQTTVSSGKGVYLLNAPRTIVYGNTIYSNSGYNFSGIYLNHDSGILGAYDGDPEDIWIYENEIYDNAYGVRILAGERIVMEANNIHDNHNKDVDSAVPTDQYKRLFARVVGSGEVLTFPENVVRFPVGSVVRVHAKRRANWQFSHWEGDLTGTNNPDSLTLDTSKEIVAVFEAIPDADEVNLTTRVKGNGAILLDPNGGVYKRGTIVTLTAQPDAGWAFLAWRVAICPEHPLWKHWRWMIINP